ncbi:MAG: alpha/beta fold hydrolase [Candidatus Paceibacterota bacterium]|jgi:dienelactone hydrolase
MKTSLHRIITEDSIELVGLLYEPEAATSKVLVHVHGMAGNFYENKFIDAIAETLTANGIALFVFNNRGCELIKDLTKIVNGKRTIVRIGNAYERFEDSPIDIVTAINFVNSRGFSEIHLSGHSLGALKVAYYSASGNDERLSSVAFLSPSDMVGLMRVDKNYDRDMKIARQMVAEGRGDELLPNPVLWDESPLSAKTYISLGGEDSGVAIFNFYDPTDTLHLLSKITIPTCAIMGRKDDALVIPVDETMERIKKALFNSPKVETRILGDADHGYNGFEKDLADALVLWIK